MIFVLRHTQSVRSQTINCEVIHNQFEVKQNQFQVKQNPFDVKQYQFEVVQ